ncbi:MAG: hypothetical protein QOI95_1184 [Acidimicrobiaceae bacterium]|jgi:hypothetical protein
MRRVTAVLIIAAALLSSFAFGPAPTASAATCATQNKSVGGAFMGEDARRLSGMVGIVLFDSAGRPINAAGCPKQPGDDGPSGYTFITLVNGIGTCCFQLDAFGAPPTDTRYANTWRIDGLPANAATVWAEAYPKSNQVATTDYSRYGGSMRRLVPVTLGVDLLLPLGCTPGGNNGAIAGRLTRNGAPVTVSAVFAFSRANEGQGQILGFVAIAQSGSADGSFIVPQLEPNQSYALSFQLTDGTTYWFENDYGAGLPVSPCATTNQNFALQPDGRAVIVEPATSGPGGVDAGGVSSVFYRAGDGSLHERSGSSITALGGQIVGAPDAATWGSGRIDVVARGTDNHVWTRSFDGSNWGGWADLGGQIIDAPTIVSWGPGRLDAFATGLDHKLWHRWSNDGFTWGGWEPLGGYLTAGPDASSWGSGRLDIVGRGSDGQTWHLYFGGQWAGWEPLGGQIVGGPASASPAPNRYEIVARGTDDNVYLRTWNGAQWLPWTPLQGGRTKSDPDAFGTFDRTTVFVVGTDGLLYRDVRPSTGSGFGGWSPL